LNSLKKFLLITVGFFILYFHPQDIKAENTIEIHFNYCSEASPVSFNPQIATDGATFSASSRAVYNRLVGIEGRSTKIVPSLAQSWTVSPDGKLITFKLRENISFHTTEYFKPTRFFNANDVLFSINRMLLKKHPFHEVGGGKYPSFESQQMAEVIEKIEKIDAHTVVFYLRRPEAPFLANLAMDFASILSEEYGLQLLKHKKREQLDKLPIGTGPFVFDKYVKDQTVDYHKNTEYFDGPVKIDKLTFQIIKDPDLRFKKIKKGECDLIPEPPPEKLAEIKNSPDLRVVQQPGLNIAYLSMSVEKPPFDKLLVRKAIHYALNREKYIRDVYDGHAQVAKNPIPPMMWSYNRRTQDYEYSVKKSKALLAEAGYANGFSTELWYAEASRPYNPNAKLMAELIQKDLAAVGISVKLRSFAWQDFLARSRVGEPPMSLQGWTGDNGDPDNFLNNLLSCQAIKAGNNRARWCNKKFSFLVDRARVTTNMRLRTKFYEEAQDIFKDEVPWVTIAHSIVFQLIRKNVEGYLLNPFDVVEFQKVSLKSEAN
jgi:dipeptide transport system substrate-binding protein